MKLTNKQKWLKERKKVLGFYEGKEKEYQAKLEHELKIKINELNKQNERKPYFNFKILEELDTFRELKANGIINSIYVVALRNIGKTTAMKKRAVEHAKNSDNKFLWIRNSGSALKKISGDVDFTNNGLWEVKTIVDKAHYEIRDIVTHELKGTMISLGSDSNKRSVEYKNHNKVFFDECFDSTRKSASYDAFAEFITTANRQQKGFEIYGVANAYNAGSDFLEKIGQPYKQNPPLLVLNMVIGNVIWNVPEDVFYSFKEKDNVGFRYSLQNEKLYTSQYGTGYSNVNENNILYDDIEDLKELYNFVAYSQELTLLYSQDKDILVIAERDVDNKLPTICFTEDDYLSNPSYVMVEKSFMSGIIKHWKNGKVLAAGSKLRDYSRTFFANILNEKRRRY